jgi:predicted nucleic acid-binding protein
MKGSRRAAESTPKRWFLDTNVFVYSFDAASPAKQRRARDLIAQSLASQKGVISDQVVQEFLNVATRKFAEPLSVPDCRAYFDQVLEPLCEIHSGPDLIREALVIKERYGYSLYDSLIVAAALEASCDRLYSEDMSDGQRIGDLWIVNPFARAERTER